MRRQGIPRVLADLDRRASRRFGRWALLAGAGLGLVAVWLLRERADGPELDLVAIQSIVMGLTGNTDVEVRRLGYGIVELVGRIEDPGKAQVLVESVSSAPGVITVLDRLWVRPPRLVS